MRIVIDFAFVQDKQTLYVGLKNIFKDCEFYGNNLDALMEVLMCLKDVEIVIKNIKKLEEKLDEYASKVINTFKLASVENDLLNVIIEEV